MCLLVVASPNSTPRKKDLENASCNNPHGFGFAVITPSGIVTGRGMSSRKIIKQFLEVRKQFPGSYAMYHARFATHGVKNDDNCHPFRVPNANGDTFLAHNGILDIAIQAGDRRSDSRIFAEDTLVAMGGLTSLDDTHVWEMVSKWAVGSKIAILTLDPNAKEQCYIVNEALGHWDNHGMWWSNYTYEKSMWASTTSNYLFPPAALGCSAGLDEADAGVWDTCPNCESMCFEDANPYYCEECMSCFDCSGIFQDTCLCWTPETDKYAYNKRGMVAHYDGYYGM